MLFLYFPLSIKRDMSAFAYGGVASVVALCYVAMIMVGETPGYFDQNFNAPQTQIRPYIFDWNFFTSCSVTFFAYTCQVQLLPVYSELANANYRRISKVIRRSLLVDLAFYLVIGVSGYFSTFNATSNIVVERPPLEGEK